MKDYDFSKEQLTEKLIQIRKKTVSLSIFRIFAFVGLIAFLVLAVSESLIWGVFFLATLAAFVYLIKNYNWQKDQEAIFTALGNMEVNRELRSERKLNSFDSGTEFQDKSHPFSNDLDLFGPHSLFQLLNHTVSKEGRSELYKLMTSEFNLEKAAQLRAAVDELAKKSVFLQAMVSIGMAFYREEKLVRGWIDWLNEKEKAKSWILFFAILGPIGGLVLGILSYLDILSSGILGIWILIGLGLLGIVFNSLKKAGDYIPARNQLKTYRYWLLEIEKQEFLSPVLKEATEGFSTSNAKASTLLDELDSLGLWIQNRANILYIPVNLFFWTDLLLYLRLQNWKRKHGELVAKFPHHLAKWETLISLGTFQNETGSKGSVIQVKEGISATGLAHPLLNPKVAVPNDFEMNTTTSIVLLTGSNMSGKTTFMRTIGINCVLVNMGLRPFAKQFGFGDFQLYTSMRNTDNLGESVSSFYAELSRIKQVILRIEAGEQIFFLLDEILKGTNTEDRIAGSEALIRQLLVTKAQGIISTHDIELAELESKLEGVKNYSFHSQIYDQTIDFDYKIKPGACPSFNAHKLMELMGIRFQD